MFISGGKQRSTGQMTHGSVETNQSRLPQHPPQWNTLFFWSIIIPAYQKEWLRVFRVFLSPSFTSVTSSPCPRSSLTHSLTHNDCVFVLRSLQVDCSSGSPRSCCLSIIRGRHGNIGAGKKGEALVAGMNEWFSDDVLVWQDAPHGEMPAGTKTG